jgi:hypothetical protein
LKVSDFPVGVLHDKGVLDILIVRERSDRVFASSASIAVNVTSCLLTRDTLKAGLQRQVMRRQVIWLSEWAIQVSDESLALSAQAAGGD